MVRRSGSTGAGLLQAAADFRYLLNRGYPREASLTLVGNRYDLDRTSRQLLHRGVFAQEVAQARRARLRPLEELAGRALALDGHNVLITLESALRGLPLVLADDGFIRDVAAISRAYRGSAATSRALELLAAYLARHQVGPLTVLYDAPLKKSGELARLTAKVLSARDLFVTSRAVPVPERELLAFPGPVATSDTHLIDLKDLVVDVAGEIIRTVLHPQDLKVLKLLPEG
jgi:hypothetical protein|uniref:DUF434 domain-containing protein n=1 Tax=Desulfobacca acetoxidans TaxID=60893 RepID=A0A7C5EKG5_9BACT